MWKETCIFQKKPADYAGMQILFSRLSFDIHRAFLTYTGLFWHTQGSFDMSPSVCYSGTRGVRQKRPAYANSDMIQRPLYVETSCHIWYVYSGTISFTLQNFYSVKESWLPPLLGRLSYVKRDLKKRPVCAERDLSERANEGTCQKRHVCKEKSMTRFSLKEPCIC